MVRGSKHEQPEFSTNSKTRNFPNISNCPKLQRQCHFQAAKPFLTNIICFLSVFLMTSMLTNLQKEDGGRQVVKVQQKIEKVLRLKPREPFNVEQKLVFDRQISTFGEFLGTTKRFYWNFQLLTSQFVFVQSAMRLLRHIVMFQPDSVKLFILELQTRKD